MHTRSRRSFSVLLLTLAVLLAACGPAEQSAGTSPSGAPTVAPTEPASGDASAPSAGVLTQTDTGWGRIWDDVPTGFPRFPGSTVADDISPEPVSATYSVANDDTAEIAAYMQSALETAAFGTEALSGPLEDGSFVLESVGGGDCRIQTSVEPMGGLTFVIIRYGAACPPG
jgi:hypothetical protein